jgi:gentisate 1,2-dioxygenase
MLKLSTIESSEAERQAYYAELRAQHVVPLWISAGVTVEPRSKAVPYVWRWRDLRPQALRAAQLVGTEEAERRVLRLANPELAALSASTTLSANIQIVMPGEIARAHRHSPAALRLIIEGKGGYTVVDGNRLPMAPGDLVLTPRWTWHDHANDTDAPMIWLDGLDSPLVRMLEAGFYEEYEGERQPIGEGEPSARWYFPFARARAALERMTGADRLLEYTDPTSGGPAMPTIACHLRMLRPGERSRPWRAVCCTNYHVIEGSGYSIVDDRRLDWDDKDVFTVPTWTFHEHVNSGDRPAFLFSFTDAPIMKALGWYREEQASSS